MNIEFLRSNAPDFPVSVALATERDNLTDCNFQVDRLGTLCDDPIGLTCSMDAARRWGKARKILPFKSFEEAAETLKQGLLDAILVPGAYPKINTLIMDSNLKAGQVFIQKIPSLVLASKCCSDVTGFDKVFHHSAVAPLLNEIAFSWRHALTATSNSEACRMHLASASSSVCITNSLCADYFELTVMQILRLGISMPWVCFERETLFKTSID